VERGIARAEQSECRKQTTAECRVAEPVEVNITSSDTADRSVARARKAAAVG
jgi:hypothetical protein